jgi:tripartite-type tricarboxylate transporter receptor subunit TctC
VLLALGRAATIKALAVTSDTRLAVAPDILTFAEMDCRHSPTLRRWGFSGPSARREGINAAAVEALAGSLVRSRLAGFGAEVFPHE